MMRSSSIEPAAHIQAKRPLKSRDASKAGRFIARLLCCVAALWLGAALATAAAASPAATNRTPIETIQQLFAKPADAASLFSPVLRAKTSPEQLTNVSQSLLDQYGSFQRVIPFKQRYVIDLAKARVYVRVIFDSKGLILGFRIVQVVQRFTNLSQAGAAFEKLPGTVSFVVEKNGKDLLASHPDAKLAVASSFKLAVLNALLDEIKAGHLSWNQEVTLKQNWRALPTGILQDWPPGTSVTVQTLAGLMISLSDNTATDAIMSLLPPQAIQKYAGSNRPLLTPRQFFALAGYQARSVREKYLKSDRQARTAMLPSIDSLPLPDVGEFVETDNKAIDWHFSVHDLCALMARAHGAAAFQIDPGVAIPQNWSAVAYKGGSDTGVLNLTTWLKSRANDRYCVSATWNDAGALNNVRMEQPYTALIALLHDASL